MKIPLTWGGDCQRIICEHACPTIDTHNCPPLLAAFTNIPPDLATAHRAAAVPVPLCCCASLRRRRHAAPPVGSRDGTPGSGGPAHGARA
eukprot:1193791-Prorocentrum_minimum.AAC.2